MRYITEFDLTNIKMLETETAIVGSGLAGLYCSLTLEKLGVKHTLITKHNLDISNSYLAQGGIAASFSPEDTPEAHLQDTLKAGKGLCITENVKILTEEGVRRVIDLLELKIPFERDEKGIPILTKEGAHSINRVLFSGDKSGKVIIDNLKKHIDKNKLLIGYELEEIITDENRLVGIIITNQKEKIYLKTKSLILATGGYSSIYERNTSAYQLSGDTLGIALRTGLKLKDLEFIQFHPTALYIQNQSAKLISEAVRGEGAILVDEKGNRFVNELKPRDEVARAIFRKYQKGEKVYLDISPIEKKGIKFEKRFPYISGILKKYNLKKLIPVSPAAHYTIGGIETDKDGRTNIEGIFAVGEVSCTGVHGANRLASNSLLECVVFSHRTAYMVYKYNLYAKNKTIKLKNKPKKSKKIEEIEIIKKLKKMMWENIGLIRNEATLKQTLKDIEKIKNKVINYNIHRKIYDLTLLAEGIVISALNRRESRGGHYRTDYPQTDEKYKKHTKIYLEKDKIKIKLEVN